jgi:hypothetical protein
VGTPRKAVANGRRSRPGPATDSHHAANESARFRRPGGGGETARLPSRARQVHRLTPRFDALIRYLEQEQAAAGPDQAAPDPERVLVLETRGSVAELFGAARAAGLQLLMEVEGEFEPDDDFQKATVRPGDVPGVIHVALGSLAAANQLRQLWATWSRGEPLVGFGGRTSGLASVFNHLQDIRPWGPQDRVRSTGFVEAVQECIDLGIAELPVEIELWFYDGAARRSRADRAVQNAMGAALPEGRVVVLEGRMLGWAGCGGTRC